MLWILYIKRPGAPSLETRHLFSTVNSLHHGNVSISAWNVQRVPSSVPMGRSARTSTIAKERVISPALTDLSRSGNIAIAAARRRDIVCAEKEMLRNGINVNGCMGKRPTMGLRPSRVERAGIGPRTMILILRECQYYGR